MLYQNYPDQYDLALNGPCWELPTHTRTKDFVEPHVQE